MDRPAHAAAFADAIGWRNFFTDRRLQGLIEIALHNNRDLRVAMLNVAAAQAQFRVQRSELFPQISLNAIGELGSLPANAAIPESAAVWCRGPRRESDQHHETPAIRINCITFIIQVSALPPTSSTRLGGCAV